ncbi:MAG TPA: hypothetical protein VNE21_05590 [Mycobacteriales bacterium]|nr:hypothetical protein [Mycobacteriales bacterium]
MSSPPPAVRPTWRTEARAALATIVSLVLLGAPVGVFWELVAPHPGYRIAGGGVSLARPESKDFIAGDGYFLLISVVVGIACGLVAFVAARRRRGPGVTFGLGLGGVLAGVVAAYVGQRQAEVFLPAPLHPLLAQRSAWFLFHVHAAPVVLGWAIAALVSYLALLAFLVEVPSEPAPGAPARPAP